MSLPLGKSPLQTIFNWLPRKSWYKELTLLRQKIVDAYQARNEVIIGGIVTDGTATAGTMMANVTALECVLNGKIKATISAISDDDLVDDATPGVEQAIYEDGTDASAITLTNDKTARVTIIVSNSKGDGTVDDVDGGTAVLIAVVKGTASTWNAQTRHLTSAEIQAALDASTDVHDGGASWAHVAQCLWADTGGASWLVTPTANRNNVLGA